MLPSRFAKKERDTMIATGSASRRRVLVVDDDDQVRELVTLTLEKRGFEVVAASKVTEALKRITTESFDVLITDLHMPNPGDGFTLITAMRHSQPDAVTLLLSAYPDVQSAMAAILLEADQIIVKPFDMGKLPDLLHERLLTRRPAAISRKDKVAEILRRSIDRIVAGWLVRSKQSEELSTLSLGDGPRTGHLPKLLEDLVVRLNEGPKPITGRDVCNSLSAKAHGELRYEQGYTPAMLVQESRILQVTIFETLQTNRDSLDFSLLLPDVMTIADEVDSQLTQTMDSYMKVMNRSSVA
jgi:DNA-binding response OmpR family regulator